MKESTTVPLFYITHMAEVKNEIILEIMTKTNRFFIKSNKYYNSVLKRPL